MIHGKAGWLVLRGTVSGLVVGGVLWLAGLPLFANIFWGLATGCGLVPMAASVVRSFRLGILRVDVVGLLAMAGALILGEYLVGAMIAFTLRAAEAWRIMPGHTPDGGYRLW